MLSDRRHSATAAATMTTTVVPQHQHAAHCTVHHVLPHTACLTPPPLPPRGLTKLIHRRRKLLEYMRRSMFERYMALIQRLGLKDIYFKQVGAGAARARLCCAGAGLYEAWCTVCAVALQLLHQLPSSMAAPR